VTVLGSASSSIASPPSANVTCCASGQMTRRPSFG
jgi:hypothetical protein